METRQLHHYLLQRLLLAQLRKLQVMQQELLQLGLVFFLFLF
jgi:hypothetical protein